MVQSSSELSKSEEVTGTHGRTEINKKGSQDGAQIPTVMGPVLHDSMVTVRLSEPSLATISRLSSVVQGNDDSLCLTDGSVPDGEAVGVSGKTIVLRNSIIEMADEMDDSDKDTIYERSWATAVSSVRVSTLGNMDGPIAALTKQRENDTAYFDLKKAGEDDGVDWEVLERTEDQEPRNQDTEGSTALLLARLEQENNLIVSNPKSGLTRVNNNAVTKRGRPPSMQQLKQMVNNPTPPQLRYSLIPAPPMTDLEFYAALVQDYKRTAQRLPTLLSKKIRAGIPPPLRGVVWQSMSGARDIALEEEYDRLGGESSPYTEIIGKDLGRSFPGVEMFRDPDGDGQRMLGKVLKCFSLYDTKIGYCQGLGFLVGPLLMHMGDKQAFCVLVRLMDAYDLRACFLPDLSGLHVRIYQFKELLQRHLSKLSAHLDHLQIEPAYVSQWFLSFFAVTCPLPMLFRIYDVIFAEGASETIMRVALSVMRKNEEKILVCTEFEDVMQLLLSRGLWDCYHMDADEFVQDFVSLTGIVTREILQSLEKSFQEEKDAKKTAGDANDIFSAGSRFLGRIWNGGNAKATTLNPGALAPHKKSGGFLRRSGSKQSMASSVNSVEASTDSMISMTTEATEVSRKSVGSDTAASVRVPSSVFANVVVNQTSLSNTNKNLHSQIEDLLLALNEMQRDQSILMTQLQKEREEREEDRHAVWELIDILKKNPSQPPTPVVSHESTDTVMPVSNSAGVIGEGSPNVDAAKDGRKLSRHDSPMEDPLADIPDEHGIVPETKTVNTVPDHNAIKAELDDAFPAIAASHASPSTTSQSPGGTPRHIALRTPSRRTSIDSFDEAKNYLWDDEAFACLLSSIESRFSKSQRPRSSVIVSKSQLRDDLAHSKEQLACEMMKTQDLQRRLHDADVELNNMREQIREGHVHIRNGLQEKNRLEKLVQNLRSKVASGTPPSADGDEDVPRRASVHGGLRELKLGRGNPRTGPTPVFNKRSSSLHNVVFTNGVGNDSPPPLPSPGLMSPGREQESPLESPSEPPGARTLVPTPTDGPPQNQGQVDQDALILELVQAKTAEAEAKQEAEEAKAKLESLRRLLSSSRVQGDGHTESSASHKPSPSLGLSPWSLGRKDSESSAKSVATTPGSFGTGSSTPTQNATPASAQSGGGFWGWGKRSASIAEPSPQGSR